MGEVIEKQSFSVKDDGTIVRRKITVGKKCSICGKKTLLGGDYCKFCGNKFLETSQLQGKDYDRTLGKWGMIFLIAGILVSGIPGLGMGTYLNRIVEQNGTLYYRYNQKARKIGIIACVCSVISIIIWSVVFYELFC